MRACTCRAASLLHLPALLLAIALAFVLTRPVQAQKQSPGAGKDATPAPALRDAGVRMYSELNLLFQQARAAAREGKFEHVFRLLDIVIRRDDGIPTSIDGELFLSVRQLAHKIILDMPENALAAYRALNDPIVRRRLDSFAAGLDIELLEDTYKTRFLSTLGDEAAFQLACFHLDQQDYPQARRILGEIHRRHPDPTIAADELLPRLALACVRSGDLTGAQDAWQELGDRNAGLSPAWNTVKTEIEALRASRQRPASEFAAAYGDGRRRGRGPAVEAADKPLWLLRWSHKHVTYLGPPQGLSKKRPLDIVTDSDNMAGHIRKTQQHPTDQAVFDGERVWYASHPHSYCYDLQTGKGIWEGKGLWEKQHTYRTVKGKQSDRERWLFLNRLSRDLSLVGDTLYRIELNHKASYVPKNFGFTWRNGKRLEAGAEIAEGNVLSAYERDSGKVRWRIGRTLGAKSKLVFRKSKPVLLPWAPAIQLDGRFDEWSRGLPLEIHGKSKEEDLGIDAAAVWTAEGVVVRAKVTDSMIVEAKQSEALSQGDSLEIFAAAFRGSWNMYQTLVSTGADPKHPELRHIVLDHRRGVEKIKAPLVQTAGVKVEGGYQLEVLLPWSNLGIAPKVGGEIGLQVCVNDRDGPKKQWVGSWYPRRQTHADPTNMHRVILANEAGRAPNTLAATERPIEWKANRVRFLAAPLPAAGRLVTPFRDELGLNLIGLDAETGVPVWKSLLVPGGPSMEGPRKPMHLGLHGVFAYLCTGGGRIACVDTIDGRVEWLAVYELTRPATGAPAESQPRREGVEFNNAGSWEEDLVIPFKDLVLAFPSDAPAIVCLDRRTGQRRWVKPRPDGVKYVVGMTAEHLVFGGARMIMAVNPATAEPQWTQEVKSTGRAALAGEEILVPADHQIQRLELATGKPGKPIRVHLPDNMPLGNLHASAAGILVAGPDRLAMITDVSPVLKELERRIAAGPDPDALAERGGLYLLLQRYREALNDLLAACEAMAEGPAREVARGRFLEAVLRFAHEQPKLAADYYERAWSLARTPREKVEIAWLYGTWLEGRKKSEAAIAVYLPALSVESVMILVNEGDWLRSGRAAIWDRLQPLYANAPEPLRRQVEEALQKGLERAAAVKDPAELVAFSVDFADSPQASAAALQAADRFARRGYPGAATALCLRFRQASDPAARRNAALKLLDVLIQAKRFTAAAGVLADIERRYPSAAELERARTALRQVKTSFAELQVKPPFQVAWKGNPIPKQSTLEANANGLGIYTSAKPWSMGMIDLRTGKRRWQLEGDRDQIKAVKRDGSPGTVIASESADWVNVIDLSNGKQVRRFEKPWLQSTIAPGEEYGFAPLTTAAHSGTLGWLDLLSGRLLWQCRGIQDKLPRVNSTNVDIRDWGLQVWGPPGFRDPHKRLKSAWYRKPNKKVPLLKFDGRTGSYEKQALDSRKWVTERRKQRDSKQEKLGLPKLKLAGGRLLRSDGAGKPLWQSPEDLKVRNYYLLGGDLALIRSAGDEAGIVRLSDGRFIWRSGKQMAWLKYLDRRLDWRNYDPNSACTCLRFDQNRVVAVARDGDVVFDGILPAGASPITVLAKDLLLVRHRTRTKVGRKTIRKTAYRVLRADGSFTKDSLPRPQDLPPSARRKGAHDYSTILRGPGVIVMQTREGKCIAYRGTADRTETQPKEEPE